MLANVSILKPIPVHLCSPPLAFSIGSVIDTILFDGFRITFKLKRTNKQIVYSKLFSFNLQTD